MNFQRERNVLLRSEKAGPKPRYLIVNAFGNESDDKTRVANDAFEELKYYLNTKKYKPEDIFVLAPSLKSEKAPIRKLENVTKRHMPEIKLYVPNSDIEKLDDEVVRNKLVFSTFHQAKGLERKVVMVFSFDSEYFTFYKRSAREHERVQCANELYVAATRSLEYVSFIHHC